MSNPLTALFDEREIAALVQRMELLPQLVRRQQEELILERAPLIACHPDLSTSGIVHSAFLGHPDQWLGCFLWEMLKAWSIHKSPAILPPI